MFCVSIQNTIFILKKDVIASGINSQIINEFKFFYLLPDKVKLEIHGNKYLL